VPVLSPSVGGEEECVMKRRVLALGLFVAVFAFVQPAFAQGRFTFGEDAHVGATEVVDDLVTMGGDAVVLGRVNGDVVSMGGDVVVRGVVTGDVVSMGGDIELAPGSQVSGDLTSSGGTVTVHPAASHGGGSVRLDQLDHFSWSGPAGKFGHGVGGFFATVLSKTVSHTLLFVLGLVLMGAARERLDALQLVMVRSPLQSLGTGILGLVASVVAIVVFAITIVGIPAAIILAVLLPIAFYVGLAAAATVVGAVLPVAALKGKPVLQLAAGVGLLFAVSFIPVFGSIAACFVACLGLGALIVTRFGRAMDLPPEPDMAGPYRTTAA